MNIPAFIDVPVIEQGEDGKYYWTNEWRTIITTLLQQLQQGASNEGLVSPSQTATNVSLLVAPQTLNGTIIYDSTNNLFKGFINGAWKTFTLT